jgi:molybdenum cofactor guanylyltransferase
VSIAPQLITGLVLAGGQGSRMGGADKGLLLHWGVPLAQHALERLRVQVGSVALSANRHLQAYQAMGVPVWSDDISGFAGPLLGPFLGPLAGWLVGLQRCTTPYLLTVPCDTPNFPDDLTERLSQALGSGAADMAIACTQESGTMALQPMFCLMKCSLASSLQHYLQSGRRQAQGWAAQAAAVQVMFDDPAAFFNANTPSELASLQAAAGPHIKSPSTH